MASEADELINSEWRKECEAIRRAVCRAVYKLLENQSITENGASLLIMIVDPEGSAIASEATLSREEHKADADILKTMQRIAAALRLPDDDAARVVSQRELKELNKLINAKRRRGGEN